MRIILKIVYSFGIFCAGGWLAATLIVHDSGKSSMEEFAGMSIFAAAIAGIIAVWKYHPNKEKIFNSNHTSNEWSTHDVVGFVDYFELLQLDVVFSNEQLKSAYKKQAIKWHPDKNPNLDTTARMQQINEAFLILNDPDSQERFQREYAKFQQSKQQAKKGQPIQLNYQVVDETLKTRISAARHQAVKLAQQSLDDIIGMSKASGKAIFQRILTGTVSFGALFVILSLLAKACG